MTVDWINAFIISIGTWLAAVNVVVLYKSKNVRGVYWKAWIFYSSCAAWDIYYYRSVSHPVSTLVSVLFAVLTTAWLVMAFKYRGR